MIEANICFVEPEVIKEKPAPKKKGLIYCSGNQISVILNKWKDY